MGFRIYQSTDAGAPVLSGTVNALVAVLDAILVTGYGAKPAAGWTKPFTGTNKAVFRPGGGNRMYLRVQDDAGYGAGAAKEVLIQGAEGMTTVDAAVAPANFWWATIYRKSSVADASARSWVCFADDRTLYFFSIPADAPTYATTNAMAFGDFYSLVPNDPYRTFLCGRWGINSTYGSDERLDLLDANLSASYGVNAMYVARNHLGAVGGCSHGRAGNLQFATSGTTALKGDVTPYNPADGSMFLSPVWLFETAAGGLKTIRGRMRGFWHFCHPISAVSHLDTVTGVGDLAGRTFMFIKPSGNSGVYCNRDLRHPGNQPPDMAELGAIARGALGTLRRPEEVRVLTLHGGRITPTWRHTPALRSLRLRRIVAPPSERHGPGCS
jgi:hypothetical protein